MKSLLKLAFTSLASEAGYYFTAWFTMFAATVFAVVAVIASTNVNAYLTLSQNLNDSGLLYCKVDYSSEITDEELYGIYADSTVYTVESVNITINNENFILISVSDPLFEKYMFQTSDGIKGFAAADGAVGTEGFLEKGQTVSFKAGGKEQTVTVQAVIPEAAPFPDLSKASSEMSAEYLFGTKTEADFPVIVVPTGLTDIPVYGAPRTVILDFGEDTAALEKAASALLPHGLVAGLTDMYDRSGSVKDGIIKAALPFIIIMAIFALMLMAVVYEYTFDRNARVFFVLRNIGWRFGQITAAYFSVAAVQTAALLVAGIAVSVILLPVLGNKGILYDKGLSFGIWFVAAGVNALCTFAVGAQKIYSEKKADKGIIT